MTDQTLPAPVSQIEALKFFNEFQAQSHARFEATLKLVMGIRGGMLTLSVGAVLNTASNNIPAHLLFSLEVGWCLLFFSIGASLFLMCSMVVATF